MTEDDDAVETLYCINHPNRETYLRCGKCERPICPRCTINTPVGARCRECAQLRKLPQYEMDLGILPYSLLGGLATSTAGWYILRYISFFRFFASVFVGIAIGDVMSRLAKRRTHTILIAGAVVNVALGWVIATAIRSGGDVGFVTSGGGNSGIYVALPLLLAAYFAYTRLR
jgi:hypothetical protein